MIIEICLIINYLIMGTIFLPLGTKISIILLATSLVETYIHPVKIQRLHCDSQCSQFLIFIPLLMVLFRNMNKVKHNI